MSEQAQSAPSGQGSEAPANGGEAGNGEGSGAPTIRRPNHYRRGTAFERRVRADLEANGYRLIRSAGSKGKIDLLAGKPGQRLAVQCKITGLLSTAEWNLLIEWAACFDAVPVLAVGGRGVRYWQLTARKTQRGKRPMVPFLVDQLAA